MTHGELLILPPGREYARRAAARIADLMRECLAERPRIRVALTGGKAPQPVYRELAKMKDNGFLDRIDWYFGDERCVPPDHPDSNYGDAKRNLLDPADIPEDRVFRMRGEESNREKAAAEYERLINDPFDIVLLGMGDDGHVASLFPGAASLNEVDRLVIPVVGPKPPPERLTITPPVIGHARMLAVMVAGSHKADMLKEALEGPLKPREIPIQHARRGVWIVDEPAASKLDLMEPRIH